MILHCSRCRTRTAELSAQLSPSTSTYQRHPPPTTATRGPDGSSRRLRLAAPERKPVAEPPRHREDRRLHGGPTCPASAGTATGVRVVESKPGKAQAWDAGSPASPRTASSTTPRPTPIPRRSARKGDYTYALPAANFVWHFSEDLLPRLRARRRPWRGCRWNSWRRPTPPKACPRGEVHPGLGGNVDSSRIPQRRAMLRWSGGFRRKLHLQRGGVLPAGSRTRSPPAGRPHRRRPDPDADGNPITDGPTLFNIIRPINGEITPRCTASRPVCSTSGKTAWASRAQYTRNCPKAGWTAKSARWKASRRRCIR